MDGVLVSTEIYHYKAWKRLADSIGISIDEHFNEQLKGVSRAFCIDLILAHGNVKKTQIEKEQLAAQKNQWFLEYIEHISPQDVFPGVIEFLTDLQANGFKMAIGSASKNAPLLLEKMQIAHYFDAIVDGNTIEKAKPNPEVFLKGAQQLGIATSACVVFEDALSGVQAAKSAGMYCIGVGSKEHLTLADECISSFTEMTVERIKQIKR
jgi:beta-phosphoglucomutase